MTFSVLAVDSPCSRWVSKMVGGKALLFLSSQLLKHLKQGTSWGWTFPMGVSQSGMGTWKIKTHRRRYFIYVTAHAHL